MKALLKIAARESSLVPIVSRGKRSVLNNKPDEHYSFMDPVAQKELSENMSLKRPSTVRGVGVETIGLGVRKAIQPSVSKNKMYQVEKYGE